MNEDKKIIQKIVVGGVLIHNEKALIIQRHDSEKIYPGMWELPSGKREPLEQTEKALIREFFEETGILVKIKMLISVFDYQTEKNNEIRDSVQINFLVEPTEDNPIVDLSSEHQKHAWIGITDLTKYNISEASQEVIKKAFILNDRFS